MIYTFVVKDAVVANNNDPNAGPAEIWFADTTISGSRYGVMFAARLKKKYQVDIYNDLGFDVAKFVLVQSSQKCVTCRLGVVVHQAFSFPC